MGLIKDKQLVCKGTPITHYEDGILTFITEGTSLLIILIIMIVDLLISIDYTVFSLIAAY